MLKEDLYRHIVDVLLAEHESSEPPKDVDRHLIRLIGFAWGIYCQIHRTARAAVTLMDRGLGQEAVVLVRVMLEHTLVLHWVIERGDAGVKAMETSQARQIRTWLKNTEQTSLVVPSDIAKELTDSFLGIDETRAVKTFRDVCRQIDADDLYVVYSFQSQFVHPTITTSNAYCDRVGSLRLTPGGEGHPANISLIAHCLIWAERSFDRLAPRPSRAEELTRLALSVEARPTLPAYHPIPPPSTKKRSRTRKR